MIGYFTIYLAQVKAHGFRLSTLDEEVDSEYRERLAALELVPHEIETLTALGQKTPPGMFYTTTGRTPLDEIQEWLHHFASREDKNVPTSQVNISGGIFVDSQGGIANSMEVYIEQLRVDEYGSPREKAIKEALVQLRKGIEEFQELGEVKKQTAATAQKSYWSLLVETISVSSGLVAIATNLGKMIGII